MRVLLVHPPAIADFHTPAPLGLGYVGATLRKAGHEVKVLDLALKIGATFSNEEPLRDTLSEFGPDHVGISSLTPQYPDAKRIARISKEYGALVTLGGAHASAIPDFILRDCKDIDYVVKGEGEYSYLNLVEGNVGSGIYYRSDGNIVGSSPSVIPDLDSLVSPWSVLNVRDYTSPWTHGLTVRRSPTCSVISSRGCPYNCSFCSASNALGKIIRLRGADNFLDELVYLKEKFGIRQFHILDDNFTFYPEHVEAVCNRMIGRKLDLVWTLPNGIRADRVDGGLLKLMKKAGCFYIAFGVESGSPSILRGNGKSLDLDAVRKASELANRLGFIVQAFFMVGFPGETEEDLGKTRELALSLPVDRISVNPVVPYPGCRLYSSLVSQGYINPTEVDWSSMNRFEWYPNTTVGRRELASFIKGLNLRFYVRPKQLVRMLSKVRSFSEIEGMWLGLRTLLRESGRTFDGKKVEGREWWLPKTGYRDVH